MGKFGWLDAINFCLLLLAAARCRRVVIAQAVLFAGGTSSALRSTASCQHASHHLGRVRLERFDRLLYLGSYRCQLSRVLWRRESAGRDFPGSARYVGAPVQASVGVARIAMNHSARGATRNVIKYVTPTFMHQADLRPDDNSGGVGQQWYLRKVGRRRDADHESAFVEMYGELGYWSFPLMAWIAFSMSVIGCYFVRAENLLCLIAVCGPVWLL